MDSLTNWYRYVDQVSRPARRQDDEPEETPAWRPWKPTPNAPQVESVVQPEAIPDLSANLGNRVAAEAVHLATPEYLDPTIHDELDPIPTFSVPELRAPTFEVHAPLLRKNGFSPASETASEHRNGNGTAHVAPPAPETEAEDEEQAEAAREETAVEAAAMAPEAPERQGPDTHSEPQANGKTDLLRHWDLLSQIRSHDVAQNSYKSPFRETREELVQRLLDPPLTLEETARLLGVCPTTVRRYTNKGHLRHFRTSGNQRRFRLSDVLEFLDSRRSEIAADAQADKDAGRQ
jgi:excisionase family DNA binding protein